MSVRPELVLAVHPTSRGFGWVLFDGPHALDDWGLAYVRGDKVQACMQRLRVLLERHEPDVLVLERSGGTYAGSSSRRIQLLQAIAEAGQHLGVHVRQYGRPEVRQCLELRQDASREDVARAVAARLPEIAHLLPPKRRAWESLHRRLAVFSASAIALTHFGR